MSAVVVKKRARAVWRNDANAPTEYSPALIEAVFGHFPHRDCPIIGADKPVYAVGRYFRNGKTVLRECPAGHLYAARTGGCDSCRLVRLGRSRKTREAFHAVTGRQLQYAGGEWCNLLMRIWVISARTTSYQICTIGGVDVLRCICGKDIARALASIFAVCKFPIGGISYNDMAAAIGSPVAELISEPASETVAETASETVAEPAESTHQLHDYTFQDAVSPADARFCVYDFIS